MVCISHLPIALPVALDFFRVRFGSGVEIFFCISGFLVTRSLYQCISREANKGVTAVIVKDFFVRRFSRIVPPYYVVLILILLIGNLSASLGAKLTAIKPILWSYPLFLNNYLRPYVDQVPGVLVVMWSLAFEEQFYLFLIAVFITFRRSLPQALIFGAIASIAARHIVFPGYEGPVGVMRHLPHFRMDSIIWGCLLWIFYDVFQRISRNALASKLALFLAACAFLLQKSGADIGIATPDTITSIGYTALIFLAVMVPDHRVTKLFCARWISFIGVISYELYLVHQIFIGLAVALGMAGNRLLLTSFSLAASIAGAYALHTFIAKPTQRYLRSYFGSPEQIPRQFKFQMKQGPHSR